MNAIKNTLIFLSLFSSSMYASVLNIYPIPNEGIYYASTQQLAPEEAQLFFGLLSPQGNLVWQKEIATVRSDAAAVSICPVSDGGILTATAYGTGYTDILVSKWSNSGEILNTDTIAYDCYDAPYQLTPFGEDYLLLWDSWSDERGLHLALVNSSGNVTETVFAVETAHPAPTILSSSENSFTVALSPAVTMEATSLVKFYELESIEWSQIPQLEDDLNPCFARDMIVKDSGEFTVIWELFEFMGKISKCVIAEYSEDGTLMNCNDSFLTNFTEVVYVKLLPDGKMILLEHSSDSSTFQIILTDIQGNEEQRIPVSYNFVPTEVDYLPDNSFLVTGETADSGGLIKVTDTGEVLWSFLLED